ncbi:reverse transcriptase domain-containing protein [Tanacetum coccineum]
MYVSGGHLKRLELKLKQFAEVESQLIKECEQLERGRQRVTAERGLLLNPQFGTRPTGLPGVGPSMVKNPGPSCQQVTGSSAQQPFILGFPTNQPMHPQMSQQSMFGLGPRLPLSAINLSSLSGVNLLYGVKHVALHYGHSVSLYAYDCLRDDCYKVILRAAFGQHLMGSNGRVRMGSLAVRTVLELSIATISRHSFNMVLMMPSEIWNEQKLVLLVTYLDMSTFTCHSNLRILSVPVSIYRLSVTNGQLPNYPFYALSANPSFEGTPSANPSFEGTSAQHPQGGYVPQALTNSNVPPYNGFMYPMATPTNNYPFYIQYMCTQPNISAYLNPSTTGLFADPTGCVTLFVRWIEDYPLLDGIKMPSHLGSYDGKGDPDNYLHLFEGAIRMQK